MIDELLGKASLKDRIDELEDENERLTDRYEAEARRRSAATRAKQDAEETCNRLEDRIAQLEGELERREEADGHDLEPRSRERLRGSRLAAVLDRLESFRTESEGSFTAMVDTPADLPAAVTDTLGERAQLVAAATPCLVCFDDAGLLSVTLDPPLKPTLETPVWDDRFAIERSWFRPHGRYALALVRADLFAVGLYEDGNRLEYHGFESDVKGSHSKGGFSQARFERIREGQIDDHLERTKDALETHVDDVPLFLTGQRQVIDTLTAHFEPAGTAAVDATGKPEAALEDAHRSFFTTELRVI